MYWECFQYFKFSSSLCHQSEAVLVGLGSSKDGGAALTRIKSLMDEVPRGETPICKQIKAVVEQVKAIEAELLSTGSIVLLVILTDGISTDGNIVDALRALEGLPVQIIVRVSSDESDTIEYWHDVNANIDIDTVVLDELECEGTQIFDNNSWLAYGDALHRAREYGVTLPAMDNVDYCQLSKPHIKVIIQML